MQINLHFTFGIIFPSNLDLTLVCDVIYLLNISKLVPMNLVIENNIFILHI